MIDLFTREEVKDIDIIVLQELWKNSITKLIVNPDMDRFELVYPTNDTKPRVCFTTRKRRSPPGGSRPIRATWRPYSLKRPMEGESVSTIYTIKS